MELHQSTNLLFQHYSCANRIIGSGCSSKVFRGTIENDGREVAIKLLEKAHNSKELYETEVHWLPRFEENPNIIRLIRHGYCQAEERYFLVFEYMERGSLLDVLSQALALRWDHISAIILGIASGVAHIHSFGLVHGDIKLANILLTQDYLAKVADFGLLIRDGDLAIGGVCVYIDSGGAGFAHQWIDVYSLGNVILQSIMLNACVRPVDMMLLQRQANTNMRTQGHTVHAQLMEGGCSKQEAKAISKIAMDCFKKGKECPSSEHILQRLQRLGEEEPPTMFGKFRKFFKGSSS